VGQAIVFCGLPSAQCWIPEGAIVFITWRLTAENTGRRSSTTRVAQIVEDAFRYGETASGLYSLSAWVIMPNHVHAVFQPKAAFPGTMRWLKGRTARVVNRVLARTGLPFWQDESYDHLTGPLYGLPQRWPL
jgi:REP element-mobilizing transposase RayT